MKSEFESLRIRNGEQANNGLLRLFAKQVQVKLVGVQFPCSPLLEGVRLVEEAVLKTVGCKSFKRSIRLPSAMNMSPNGLESVCKTLSREFDSPHVLIMGVYTVGVAGLAVTQLLKYTRVV